MIYPHINLKVHTAANAERSSDQICRNCNALSQHLWQRLHTPKAIAASSHTCAFEQASAAGSVICYQMSIMSAMMQEGHNIVGNYGEHEAAEPVPCSDPAHSEAMAASASKSRQNSMLQPETLYASQAPGQAASLGVCIQARVLPPTGCTNTIMGQEASIGPAGAADFQSQPVLQV